MKEDQEAERANHKDEKENAESEAFFHADQHSQPDINILKARTMKEDREAEDASHEDEKESAESEAFFHADQHSQSDTHILCSAT